MKKIFTFLIFFFYINPVFADKNIVYLDIQYIIDNSNLGKFYKTKIKINQDKNKEILQIEQKKLKEKEQEINNQKNILKKEELNKQLVELNNLVVKYRELKKELNTSIVKEKKKYST